MSGLEAGSTIGGYRIERVAGRGGMGVVYHARQLSLDRSVALKVIASGLADDPVLRRRFLEESKRAASIRHPNVIPVHDAREEDGVLFIVMDFINGVDLRGLLVTDNPLPPRRVVAIVGQIADALDAAHAVGLVHRDVKPANVLIESPSDHVYLTDFGLAKQVDADSGLTRTGDFIGTLDYVAPEQCVGSHVDARTDVYALGCVLYQMLTGRVPYPHEGVPAKLWSHMNDPRPRVTDARPDLPPAFNAVVARAMAISPEDRYLSAGDLGQAARASLEGMPVSRAERSVAVGSAAPPTPVAPVPAGEAPRANGGAGRPPDGAATIPRAARRRPERRLLILGGVLMLALVGGAIALFAGGGGRKAGAATTSTAVPARAGPAPDVNAGLRILASRDATLPANHRSLRISAGAPPAASASARVPLYITLSGRAGAGYQGIDRLRVPLPFRGDSVISSLTVDPVAGSPMYLQGAVSWFVRPHDQNGITRYFTITANRLSLD